MLDIHTHHAPPQPQGVIAVSPEDFSPVEGQAYSVGIHPWNTIDGINYGAATSNSLPAYEEIWRQLEKAATNPQVVAIGECGIDLTKGGPMFRQLQVFKRQVELSEKLQKPIVIHCVKAYDVVLGLKRDLAPTQNWCIHGFRGKPAAAIQLMQKGIYLSLGEYFNQETLRTILENETSSSPLSSLLLAETDESPLPIEEIISRLEAASGRPLAALITSNTSRFLHAKP